MHSRAVDDAAMAGALRAGRCVDSDHPAVREFAARVAAGCPDEVATACALYLAVRDGFRYDPYQLDLTEAGMSASRVIAQGHGWCVTKAALLAAACRARGIAARVGYADVRNHLSTARLREAIGTDDYVWHGYTAILLRGRWCKATPAFNATLCDKLGIARLEFDGSADSIYQAHDAQGRRHMEYIAMRGEFDDVPVAAIRSDFVSRYPALIVAGGAGFDFDADIEHEAAR